VANTHLYATHLASEGAVLPDHDAVVFDEAHTLEVASPFDFRRQAVLHVARHLPDPRSEAFPAAMHDELHRLVTAAGGRTLALFTSKAAMQLAQGAGRLVRRATDEGVVAVFDRRLALMGYRRTLLATMPPFRRSVDPADAVAVLERLAAAADVSSGRGTA